MIYKKKEVNMIVCALVAGVDRLYWAIFGVRDSLIPPKPQWWNWWFVSIYSAIGGVAGGFAISRITDSTDLFTMVIGALIGGRLVGGMIESIKIRNTKVK
jgi:hypothetical protein